MWTFPHPCGLGYFAGTSRNPKNRHSIWLFLIWGVRSKRRRRKRRKRYWSHHREIHSLPQLGQAEEQSREQNSQGQNTKPSGENNMDTFGVGSMHSVVQMPMGNSMHRQCRFTYLHTCAYLHTNVSAYLYVHKYLCTNTHAHRCGSGWLPPEVYDHLLCLAGVDLERIGLTPKTLMTKSCTPVCSHLTRIRWWPYWELLDMAVIWVAADRWWRPPPRYQAGRRTAGGQALGSPVSAGVARWASPWSSSSGKSGLQVGSGWDAVAPPLPLRWLEMLFMSLHTVWPLFCWPCSSIFLLEIPSPLNLVFKWWMITSLSVFQKPMRCCCSRQCHCQQNEVKNTQFLVTWQHVNRRRALKGFAAQRDSKGFALVTGSDCVTVACTVSSELKGTEICLRLCAC